MMSLPQELTGRIDLHTHSRCSDGTLAPAELVRLAATRSVTLLALTDHDTLAGLAEARLACQQLGIRFVPGVELSSRWRDLEVHVLGLGIDADDAALRQLCEQQRARREARIQAMAERLSALGLPGSAIAAQALRSAAPTRSHLAAALHARGLAASAQDAFDTYLSAGRPAFVASGWPPLSHIVAAILAARGVAVLAHPHRYRLARSRMAELASEFKNLGGGGLEVSVAGMSLAEASEAARLARRFDLAGSIGSDFHHPGLPWRPLGRLVKLPQDVTPITARLAPAHSAAS
jgi:predicted metal-dependent phosphoesterase TrpH